MKHPFMAIGAIAIVAVLAAAAYIGGQLLVTGTPPTLAVGGDKMLMATTGGKGGSQRTIQINKPKPAPELPQTPPDVAGIFVRRQDNSIFVGTGKIRMTMSRGSDGNGGDVATDYDGPVVEVVVTGETTIYQDVTDINKLSDADSAQQVVKPGSLEDLHDPASVTVWGERRGDRVVAKTLVFHVAQPISK